MKKVMADKDFPSMESGQRKTDRTMNKLVYEVKTVTQSRLEQIRTLNEIGMALSAEKSIGRLLEMVVEEARKLVNADGGTLYIMDPEDTALRFAIVQNGTLNLRMGGTSGEITWYPVSLRNPDGTPNHANVSAHAALTGEVVNIADVYEVDGFNFQGTRKFDAKTGYRSKSMLVVPMRNHENDIIGVLQLINVLDAATGEVITFSPESLKMTESLASQAAVALTNNLLIRDLENLFEAFIKSIATAIDEKSPYTAGHISRVSELVLAIANGINEAEAGPFADTRFDRDQIRELEIAAWLHDIGKITTPESIVDKATKLETIFDRIELLKTRFEVLKRDAEIDLLKKLVGDRLKSAEFLQAKKEYDRRMDKLRQELAFLVEANMGAEFMSNDKIDRLKAIARREWKLDGVSRSLLTRDELDNLSIRHGTLTEDERRVINNHAAVSYKMLSQLPFPRRLKKVPDYAAGHHERPDGSGYPFGLRGDMLPLQTRIIALADIFEALTAKDRPYAKARKLSEVIRIMSLMAADNHIDSDLFEFFVRERIYMDYARKELSPDQVDEIGPDELEGLSMRNLPG